MRARCLLRILGLPLAAACVLACAGFGPSTTVPDHIAAAVAHPDRAAEDRERDSLRRPAEVLAFFQIEPGMVVADLMAGSGYYTELLARSVGPEGAVYAHNNRWLVDRFGERRMSAVRAKPGLGHIVRWIQDLDDLKLPEGKLDAVLMILFYHDTYWLEVDRAAMNRQIFAALAPGGIYGVVDHHAVAGSGTRDVKTLHRGDAEQIKAEILRAGFVFEGASEVLRHPADDRLSNVFDPDIRGRSDRFVYRFRKPAGP